MGQSQIGRLLPLLVTAFVMTACGGGTAPSAASSNTTAGAVAANTGGNVLLSITLPGTGAAAALRKPAFVSSATAGVLISAYLSTDTAHANLVGGAAAAVGLGAPGCSSTAPITCLVPIGVPPSPAGGSTAFVVTLYNQAPANGVFSPTAQVLGLGNTSQVITANGSNALSLSVLGVAASGTLAFPSTIAVTGGVASYYPLTVTVLDAAGQPIQGTFASPVQLTTTNAAITSFVINGQPGTLMRASTDSVSVLYNGGSGSANLSFTGTAPSFTANAVSFVPSSGAPSASPSSLRFPGGTRTFTVSEPNYTGAAYTESDNCAGVATISPSTAIGSTVTFTVVANPFGACSTITIVDSVGQTVTIPVTLDGG